MGIKIALAGNPNCGKTTLFNALTGSNQFVGNWPGVTVEKKEGKLKKYGDVILTDLPGIYSLSPYTLEEVVARNYLIDERPDVILDVIDGTNIERNLYLTTQLAEIGVPVVAAINMMDVVRRKGDKINTEELSRRMGCKVCEISALKGTGLEEAVELAIEAAKGEQPRPRHIFSGVVEHALAHIEEGTFLHDLPEEQQRWYSIKIFERDEKVLEKLKIPADKLEHIEKDIRSAELELDDDAESIITNERYNYIDTVIKASFKRKNKGGLTTSDKIDKVITNRFLALPIFAVIMIIVYYISVSTVGTHLTNWMNNGVFGDGWHLFGIGSAQYQESVDNWADKNIFSNKELGELLNQASADKNIKGASKLSDAFKNKDYSAFEEAYGSYADEFYQGVENSSVRVYDIRKLLPVNTEGELDNPVNKSEYGVWIPGVPVIVENGLDAINCADWLKELVLKGIVGGVGSVLGFVPQILVLFLFLAFLEGCGYMSRIAFVMDKIFRKFGLSGKSFIPILIGTGCGVPGIMASRTIENERDRRMTIMTTTFIPCGAKLPVIAMISTALFDGAWWVAPSAYFLGMASIVISGIMLKKTKMFAGDPAPFVMELPAYHMPTFVNVFRSMWDRGWSFIKKAGTVILLASIVIWAGSVFGWYGTGFGYKPDLPIEHSILGAIGNSIQWIFTPLGFADIKTAIATIMGIAAKEEIVGVFGVLDFGGLTPLSAYSFLAFNLLCAPCVAAIAAIRREMNSPLWTAFAIGYQCVFAYAVSLVIFQVGSIFTGGLNIIGLAFALAVTAFIIYMLARPFKESDRLK